MDLHDGDPFWPRRDGLLSVHPPMSASTRCDVLVVGAGITGALVALELCRRGHRVVVIDRRDVGGGSTSASTSMLQYEIDTLLIELAEAIGFDDAALAYQACRRGIDQVETVTQQIGDNCGFRRSPSLFVAKRAGDVEVLQAELEARSAAGFDVEWIDADRLAATWGLVGHGAIVSVDGGSVDPYRLAHRALARAIELGADVFDRTMAVDYEIGARSVKVATDRGAVITARQVVVATGYEVEQLLPDLPIDILTSFALVTEPVEGLDHRYPDGLLFWDHDDPYLYGRTTDDGRLLIGGRDEPYRDPRRRRRALPAKARALMRDLGRRFPGAGEAEMAFAWCGSFAETPDGLAYIGPHSSMPRLWFALGFGGNGITYSAMAAQYIADGVERRPADPSAGLFALQRPVRSL